MAGITDFLAARFKRITPESWDSFVRWIDSRFRVLEEKADITDRVADSILARGLQVIEDGIGPAIIAANQAAANVSAMADLGLVFFAKSATSLSINENNKSLTIVEASRAQFAPAAFVIVNVAGDIGTGFVGRRISYNRLTGVLVLKVEQTFGTGTFNDWEISPIATTADLEALRDQIIADRVAVQELRNEATSAAGTATSAASSANTSKTAAQTALTDFRNIWLGAFDVAPANAVLGAGYLDTSETPNVFKVMTEDGWQPTVTVSIGGSRMQTYTATAGQTGPFVVDGGFSIGSVNVNGVELFNGHGVTLDPVAGTFTFTAGRMAGDLVVFRGYLANDMVDHYTKSETNGLLDLKANTDAVAAALAKKVGVTGAAGFTEAEKGQARANIGGGVLAGFRSKIINGDFPIWQRGVAFNNAAFNLGSYCADRWLTRFDATGSDRSFTRQAFAAGQTDVPGEPEFFGRYSVTATGTGGTYRVLEQKIENVRTLAGKKATLTLYAKAAAAMVLPQIRLRQDFGTGGTPSGPADVVAATNAVVGTSWAKLQYVVDVPPLAGKSVGTAGDHQLALTIFLPPSATFTFDIAHVSLVEGDATKEDDPFSPRHIQQEEALCLRYYREAFTGARSTGDGYFLSTREMTPYMRAAPSIRYQDTNGTLDRVTLNGTPGNTLQTASFTAGYRNLTFAGRCFTAASQDVQATLRLDAEL